MPIAAPIMLARCRRAVPSATPPHAQPLSSAALAASTAAALQHWNRRDPLWVFGYASLIWNPQLEYDARVVAQVHGYHRQLCMWSVQHRGSPDCPGLVAGLDRGGSCCGVAFRIPARAVADQFARLWRREMALDEYAPRWLSCRPLDRSGAVPGAAPIRAVHGAVPFHALAFVVRRATPYFSGRLAADQQLEIVLRAHGQLGSNLDYLLQTVAALRAEGLPDRHLEQLAQRAERLLAARSTVAAPS